MTIWEMNKTTEDGKVLIYKTDSDKPKTFLGESTLTHLENVRSFMSFAESYDWLITTNGPFWYLPERGEKNN